MTKEAILNKHDTSSKYIEQTCRPELFSAMDEYAKQQAIAFLKWAMESSLCGDNYGGVFIVNDMETEESDETRAFQNHIFSQWLKTMEEANGLFL